MPGMPVNFEAHVDQSVNVDLLVRVAEVSMQALKVRPVANYASLKLIKTG